MLSCSSSFHGNNFFRFRLILCRQVPSDGSSMVLGDKKKLVPLPLYHPIIISGIKNAVAKYHPPHLGLTRSS